MRAVLLLALLSISGVAFAAAPTAEQVLAQSKAANGGSAWNAIHTLHSEGTVEIGGLSGPVTALEDLSTGRSVSRGKLGAYTFAQGYDGTIGWSLSPNGEVSPNDSAAAKKRDKTAAYQSERAWWFPGRWPAKIELIGTRTADQVVYRVLRIAPRGGNPFELWIDAETYRIARFVDRSGTVPRTTYFSDYRTVNGVTIPFHQRVSNGKKKYDTVVQLKKISTNVPVSDADFAAPKQTLHDFAFVDGGSKATIPFDLVNNHIYIDVAVDGHPLRFILDTGGVNILTPAAAKAAGIKSKGALQGRGVGKKSVDVGFAKVRTLTLGGKVALHDQTFMVFPLPGYGQVEGVRFDGIVGYEVFKRLVARIDYAHGRLTLMRPSAFKSTGAGTAVPFVFIQSRIPGVRGSIDGLEGLFEIDTGNRAALSLWSPFAKAHDLYTRYRATPEMVVGWGVGGKATGRIARGGRLKIGSVVIDNPVLELSLATRGAGADKHIAGNIGGGILNRFTVTLDYAHQRMYLKPNDAYGTPMTYDRSGMWVNGLNGDFVVKSALAGGPAARAGLKAGDVITAVDGKPAAGIGLANFRAMLRGAPGTRLRLTVKRGANVHTVTLVLQRLVPATGGLKKAA